jgi:hypothetical protein
MTKLYATYTQGNSGHLIDELKLVTQVSTFRSFPIRLSFLQLLRLMEWIMRDNQRELGTGSSAKDEASAGRWAAPNGGFETSQIAMRGLPLPPPGAKRWWPHRKAAVVAAVRGGILSLNEAQERYALSIEEYLTWQHGIDLFGLAGLRMDGTQRRRAKTRVPQTD